MGENTKDLKERCVFILATLGLSISQLLGQNDPSFESDVRPPFRIFNAFVDAHGLDPNLKTRFERFNDLYNGCRHFGKTTTGTGYLRVDQLTYQVAKECFEFGMEVWQTVINVYRNEEDSDLDDFDLNDLP